MPRAFSGQGPEVLDEKSNPTTQNISLSRRTMDPQLEILAKITHVPEKCQLQDAAISLGLQFDFCIYVHQQLFWVPADMEHIGYMLCKIPSG